MEPQLIVKGSGPLSAPSQGRPSPTGFTLIELLVVIALIAIVAGFAGPAFNSIGQSRGATESAYILTALVEQARAEAVGRNTHVWLGFRSVTNFGNRDLHVALIGSVDGSSDTSSDNLELLSRPAKLERVALLENPDLGEAPIQLPSFEPEQTLTFTPTGEVTREPSPRPSDGFLTNVSLVLMQTRGTMLLEDQAITNVIDGSTGLPFIIQ